MVMQWWCKGGMVCCSEFEYAMIHSDLRVAETPANTGRLNMIVHIFRGERSLEHKVPVDMGARCVECALAGRIRSHVQYNVNKDMINAFKQRT